ncbi:hypothetical protein LB505_014304 [Fusarium chuoi]|nr:hypothetical protein LB505_014304 [Fusarium chuoi]
MTGIQDNAELAVRAFFRKLAHEHPAPLSATDYLDDGTAMKVRIMRYMTSLARAPRRGEIITAPSPSLTRRLSTASDAWSISTSP